MLTKRVIASQPQRAQLAKRKRDIEEMAARKTPVKAREVVRIEKRICFHSRRSRPGSDLVAIELPLGRPGSRVDKLGCDCR